MTMGLTQHELSEFERKARRAQGADLPAAANDRVAVQLRTLELPYPPSANRYWRSYVPKGHRRAIIVPSEEAQEYKRKVCRIALAAGIRYPIKGRVALDFQLYPERPLDWAKRARRDHACWDDTVQCIDLDNALKITIDAIKDIVISDDKYVRRITAERMEPDAGAARLIMTVSPMPTPISPQSMLL